MDFLVSQTLKRAGPRTGTEIAPADRPFLNQSLFSWGYVGAQERRSLQPTGPLQKHFVVRANSNRLVVVVIHIPTAVWSGKYCYPATAFPSSSIVGTDFGTGDIYLLLLGLGKYCYLATAFPSSSFVGTDSGTGDIYLLLLGLANTATYLATAVLSSFIVGTCTGTRVETDIDIDIDIAVALGSLLSYRMVLSVRRRIQWGIGLFCFIFLPRVTLVRKVLWEGCRARRNRFFRGGHEEGTQKQKDRSERKNSGVVSQRAQKEWAKRNKAVKGRERACTTYM